MLALLLRPLDFDPRARRTDRPSPSHPIVSVLAATPLTSWRQPWVWVPEGSVEKGCFSPAECCKKRTCLTKVDRSFLRALSQLRRFVRRRIIKPGIMTNRRLLTPFSNREGLKKQILHPDSDRLRRNPQPYDNGTLAISFRAYRRGQATILCRVWPEYELIRSNERRLPR